MTSVVLNSIFPQINATTCAKYPSKTNITNVLFENFTGYSSGKYGQAVAKLSCSPNAVCENIRFKNFNITTPCGGETIAICDGISGDIGIPCYNSTSPEATAALKAKCTTGMASLPSATPW